MLGSEKLTAFVSTTNAGHARAFYRDTLGLRLISEDGFALVFDCNGVPLRISLAKEVIPHKYTVLGWEVNDIRASIAALKIAGVAFEFYGFLKQDDLGIWKAPGGTEVAWFKDPDGNLLSLSNHA
jgi:catechol 2,3-dioxygenase-like lactoylglutathione lyase family enzyme